MATYRRNRCLTVTCVITFLGLSIILLLYSSTSLNVNPIFFLKTKTTAIDQSYRNGAIDTFYANTNSLHDKLQLFNRHITDEVELYLRRHFNGDIYSYSNLNISKLHTNYTVKRGYVDGFYTYKTPVKNTLTFILSWKSSKYDQRVHVELLKETLPVWNFYHCIRGPNVAKLGGWVCTNRLFLHHSLYIYINIIDKKNRQVSWKASFRWM